ncbi:unnamed protein product [Symbiodinium sp. CCMP2592]|nr:unnamed protein product [Symbiodinium sp. CCMP2592]
MLAVLCGSTHQYTASPYNKLWQVTNGNSTNSATTNGTADAVAESAKPAGDSVPDLQPCRTRSSRSRGLRHPRDCHGRWQKDGCRPKMAKEKLADRRAVYYQASCGREETRSDVPRCSERVQSRTIQDCSEMLHSD